MFLRRVLTSGVCIHATCCAGTYIEVAGRFTMTLMHDALHFLETQLDDYKAAFAALETKYNQVQEQLFAEQERGRDLNQVQERLRCCYRDFECQLLAEQERVWRRRKPCAGPAPSCCQRVANTRSPAVLAPSCPARTASPPHGCAAREPERISLSSVPLG